MTTAQAKENDNRKASTRKVFEVGAARWRFGIGCPRYTAESETFDLIACDPISHQAERTIP
jgi:hypothetical protein